MIGFTIMLASHAITMYMSPDLKTYLPSWVWFMNAFAIILYQLLDNLDGK